MRPSDFLFCPTTFGQTKAHYICLTGSSECFESWLGQDLHSFLILKINVNFLSVNNLMISALEFKFTVNFYHKIISNLYWYDNIVSKHT